MNKLRVGVLMGGMSIEREVSFNSGRTICDHLDTAKYVVIPIFQHPQGELYILPWHFLHRGKTTDFQARLDAEAQTVAWDDLSSHIDFMYIATHGRYAEDGIVQGILEVMGIPYLGSGIFASAIGMNKTIQKKILAAQGIAVPRGIVVESAQALNWSLHQSHIVHSLEKAALAFPLIVKPQQEGSSLGVTLVRTIEDLPEALHHACTIYPEQPQPVLVEEWIQGMEFSCTLLVDKYTQEPLFMPPTEVIARAEIGIFDYEQKYMPGAATEYTPARCSLEVQQLIQKSCAQAMKVLGFTTMARIDGFVTADNTVVIIDCNTLSGMGPASFLFREAACIGMSHTHVINHLIETDLHRRAIIMHKEHTLSEERPKMRVGVLLGGNTNEREISLESGRNVCYKLSPHRYTVLPLFVSSTMKLYHIGHDLLVRNSTHEIESLVTPAMHIKWNDLPGLIDFAFIGLHGGLGENGGVQATLEMLKIPYNGSGVLASALCMNKYKANEFLKSQGFKVPDSNLISNTQWSTDSAAIVHGISSKGFPRIVKPSDDGCSVMVAKVNSSQALSETINMIFASGKQEVLVEEYIDAIELTVGVIGNDVPQALMPTQVMRSADILSIQEKFLPGCGENQTPPLLPQEAIEYIQQQVQAAYQAIGCAGYARIDCFYKSATQSSTGTQEVIFIEFNTLPGLTPATCIFHQAAECGMRPMEFIDKIIQAGLERYTTSVRSLRAEELSLNITHPVEVVS